MPGAEERLRQILEWAGLPFDESPWVGGNYGPYRQSERLDIYRKYAEELLTNGLAYRCFCTQQELARMRAEQSARGLDPKYNGRCRTLTQEQVQHRLDQGQPHVIRQRLPEDRAVSFADTIRGEISFNTRELDDQVLIKSDGFPTYHLAHVVDDHLMEISHVLRGEEWISSAPKHILLFEAFGWSAPQYSHLPLILNTNRQKLSKRSGDVSAFVEEFRDQGVLPGALINYIALLGWHPEGDREIYDFGELAELFDLGRVGKAGAVFDATKLFHLNGVYIRSLPEELYLMQSRRYLEEAHIPISSVAEAVLDRILLMLRDRITRFSEIPEQVIPMIRDDFDYDNEADQELRRPGTTELLLAIAAALSQISEFSGMTFKDAVTTTGKQLSRKGRDLWMPVRAALTGRVHGPDLNQIADILGKEACLRRLRRIVARSGLTC